MPNRPSRRDLPSRPNPALPNLAMVRAMLGQMRHFPGLAMTATAAAGYGRFELAFAIRAGLVYAGRHFVYLTEEGSDVARARRRMPTYEESWDVWMEARRSRGPRRGSTVGGVRAW